jgi:hypothetical protein
MILSGRCVSESGLRLRLQFGKQFGAKLLKQVSVCNAGQFDPDDIVSADLDDRS